MAWLNTGMRRQDIVGGIRKHQWVIVQPSGARFSNDHNDNQVYLNGVVVDPLLAVYFDILNEAGATNHPLNGRLGLYVSVAAATGAPTAGVGVVTLIEAIIRGHKTVVANSVGRVVAEWDSRTGKTVANGISLGNNPLWADAWIAIQAALTVTSPSEGRGIGPFTNTDGGIWRIRLPDYAVMFTPPGGVEATHPEGGWGCELADVPDHDRVYHRGPYTTNFMYPDGVSGWPEYDPAEFSLPGVPADGRDPITNELPPVDSPHNTFGVAVSYWHSNWSLGAGAVDKVLLRDGIPFLTVVAQGLLVYQPAGGVLSFYWVTSAGVWGRFVPGNGFAATTDPRETGPVVGDLVMTTGSISADSNVLTVASATGFSVDDKVIVEIGQEPGAGLRGTRGVGDQWPSFGAGLPSLAAAIALYGEFPSGNFYIWINDTGSSEYGWVYWGRQFGWIWLGDLNWSAFTGTGDYYAALRIPRSLQARIASINGTQFTLADGPTNGFAKVSVTGATVYRDEIEEINAAVAAVNLQLSAGDHCVGGAIHIDNAFGRILEGATANRAETRVFTPKGVPCMGIDIENSPSTIIRNLTVQGNWRDNGHGPNYGGVFSAHYEAARGVQETSDFAYSLSVGIRANPGSSNTEFRNVAAVDMPIAQFSTSFCDNVWAYDCDAKYTDPLRQYMQWAYYWTDTTGGGGIGCTCSGSYMFPGFESFKSSNVSYIDCGGIGTMSMNGSRSWLIQNFHGVYPANSCVNTPTGIGHQQPIVNINNNINMPSSFLTPGGHIDGMILDQQGYVNGGNISMACALKVQLVCPNVLVEGFENICPDYAGGQNQGAQAVDSEGPNLILRDSIFRGKARWTAANNQEHQAVLYVRNQNTAACVNLSLPDDPNSKFYF